MKENKVLAEINFSTNGAAGKSTDALSKVDKLKEGIYKAAVKEAYDKAAKNIVDYFAPSISSEIANFENVKDKSYKKKLKALLKGNELEQAYQIYQEIAAKDPAAVEPVYNMGLINEIVGNYETARDLYTVAFEKKSNKKYLKAKQDAEKTLEVIKTLNLQIPVYPLEKSQKKLTQTN